jgi:NAD(P) transhydrogenase
MQPAIYDIVVIGSGPAGQKAAIQGAKAGQRVVVIEQDADVGGICVHRGTIPSKTLRESAILLARFKQHYADIFQISLRPDLEVASLMTRLHHVVQAHVTYMEEQLLRNGIDCWHGRAGFVSPHELEVLGVKGERRRVRGRFIVVGTGSRPRVPANIPIDHEHILDSDSVLSMLYLPASLTVLGAGVIASEYASMFATLGVQVTIIDQGKRPLGFLDAELTDRFVQSLEERGGRFLGQQKVVSAAWDGLSAVETLLASGEMVKSEKLLCALGRSPNLEGLNIDAAGLTLTDRGFLAVNAQCQTCQPHVYAVGDVIGPPSLAASAMEQGRRAVCHALDIEVGAPAEMIPVGIYTIPEMSSVGLNEEEAMQRYGSAIVGRAPFSELARGQITGCTEGLLKLVADPTGQRLLGVQIIGEGATELIHVGEIGILAGCDVESFVEHIFNFPTLAEGYRVAALDIVKKRRQSAYAMAVPDTATNSWHHNGLST